MSERWSWDFEDERAARREVPATPAQPDASPPPRAQQHGSSPPTPPRPGASARTVQVRRRRFGAGLLVLVALIAVIAAAAGSGSSGSHRRATAATGKPKVAPKAPSDPEKDGLTAVSSVRAYTPFVREGGTKGHDIALTFDDGPGPYTPQVLSVLERLHVPATFFVIGRMLQYFSASTVREIEDGDVIGDHTESHPMLAKLSAHDQYEELFEQIARIELLGGHRPVLFRPPYGSFDATTMRQLAKLRLLMVLWSVDTDDYEQPGVSVIVERALAGAHPGAIILLHDAGGVRTQTIEALPLIVKGLRAKGYSLVTVPKLLADDPPPAGEPLPPNLSGD